MYQSVSMNEFEQLVKQTTLTVIDVREVGEFENGHIHNAINIPLGLLEEQMATLKEPSYYVICHSGGRSQVASQLLASSGYEITNVLGGMSAWNGAISTE
ncbi:rhodanese-like domain-containing protein [Enterococcus sp. LJL99]